MGTLYYMVRFQHPDVPGKLLVFATEVTEEHQRKVAPLAGRDGLSMDDALKLAAVMNICQKNGDLEPVSVEQVSEQELASVLIKRGVRR